MRRSHWRPWLAGLFIAGLTLSCSLLNPPKATPLPTVEAASPTELPTLELPTPEPPPTSLPSDTPVPPPTNTPIPSPTPTLVPPTPTLWTGPAITNRYTLKAASNPDSLGYDHLAASPGKMWISEAKTGIVEIRDAATGTLERRFSFLEPPARSNPYALVQDMLFDGERMWILYIPGDQKSGVKMAVIQDSDYTLVTTIILPDFDSYYARLGKSPGKIWLRGLVFDEKTQNLLFSGNTILGPAFAFDGKWMWTAGDPPCTNCGNCIVQFSNDLEDSRSLDVTLCTLKDQLVSDGLNMWSIAHTDHGYFLQAFELDSPPLSPDADPLISININDELSASNGHPARMLLSNRTLWLLDAQGGAIHGHEIRNGKETAHLEIITRDQAGAFPFDFLMDLTYDGQDLWALTSFQLVRISLP